MPDPDYTKYPQLADGSDEALVSRVKAILRSQGMWDGSTSTAFGPSLRAAVQYFQSTHLGPNAQYLSADGIIGPNTWWALDHPSGPDQKSNLPASDMARYAKLSESRQKHLAVLWGEHAANVREIPDGSNCGDGVDKYIEGYGPVYWCALFQSWCWHKASGQWPHMHQEASVANWWEKAISGGYGYRKGKYAPLPGDLIAYQFGGGSGHITAIVAVAANGLEVNTIGGNEGNRVKLGYRNMAQEDSIVGYINLHGDHVDDFPRGLLSDAETSAMDQAGTR